MPNSNGGAPVSYHNGHPAIFCSADGGTWMGGACDLSLNNLAQARTKSLFARVLDALFRKR